MFTKNHRSIIITTINKYFQLYLIFSLYFVPYLHGQIRRQKGNSYVNRRFTQSKIPGDCIAIALF